MARTQSAPTETNNQENKQLSFNAKYAIDDDEIISLPKVDKREVGAVIAIDIGHSSVKTGVVFSDPSLNKFKFPLNSTKQEDQVDFFACLQNFPTSIYPDLTFLDRAAKIKAKPDFVQVYRDGKFHNFHVGHTAQIQGEGSYFSNTRGWIEEIGHDALLLSALERNYREILKIEKEHDIKVTTIMLELGLPTVYFSEQRPILVQSLNKVIQDSFLKNNEFKEELKNVKMIMAEIKMQSEAPLWSIFLTPEGDEFHFVNQEGESTPLKNYNIWVSEFGHHSTDTGLYRQGQMIQNTLSSIEGLSSAYANIRHEIASTGINSNLKDWEIEEILKTNKCNGIDVTEQIQRGLAEFNNNVLNSFVKLANYNDVKLVVLTGGAAHFSIEAIRNKYNDKEVFLLSSMSEFNIPNDRFAVTVGLLKLGLHRIKQAQAGLVEEEYSLDLLLTK